MPSGVGDIQLNLSQCVPITGAVRPSKRSPFLVAKKREAVRDTLPFDMQIRLQADSGKPTVVYDPDGEVAQIYKAVARQVAVKIAAKAKDFSSKFPTIKVSKDT
jgi:MinD-like ATPase involved in chromosome partitioning or flagellar assembly